MARYGVILFVWVGEELEACVGIIFYVILLSAFLMVIMGRRAYKKRVFAGNRLGSLRALVAVLVGLAVVFVCVVMQLVHVSRAPGSEREELGRKTSLYEYKVYQYLGDYLASNHAGKSLVVLNFHAMDPPSDSATANLENRLNGLKAGLAGRMKITEVVYPEIPASGMSITPATLRTKGAKIYDSMLKGFSSNTLVLSFIGLPDDYRRMKTWRRSNKKRPKLVLINARFPDVEKMIRNGRITATMTVIPDPPKLDFESSDWADIDFKEAFNKRCVMIDSKVLDQVIAKYPDLF